MKGFMKKAAAVFMTAAMAATAFTGCSKSASGKGANTMFTTLKEAAEVEKADVEVNVDVNYAGTKAELKITGTKDGKATSCGVSATVAGMTFELDNIMVYTDDVIYINYAEIMDEFSTYLSAAGVDPSPFGLEADWLSLEMKGAFDTSNVFSDDIAKALDTAFADIIVKDGSTYSIKISDKDSVQAFIDGAVKLLEDNKDMWVNEILDQYNNADLKDSLNGLVDQLTDALVKNGVDQSVIDELKSEVSDELGTAESEMTKDDLGEAIDEMVDELKSAEAEDIDGRVKYTVSKEKDVYTQSIDINVKSDEGDMVMNCTTTVTPNKKASVEVPSDAESIVDIIAAVLAGYMAAFE